MTQVFFKKLEKEWTSFEEMVGSGFSATATYELQNRGNYYLLALESDTLPENSNMAGLIIKPLDIFSYKKGVQTLYLKALSEGCVINTRSDEEMSEYAPNLIKKSITENGRYRADEEGADGFYEVMVDVPVPEVSGQIKITTLDEVDVSQYETAQISDANLTPENIKSGVEILGIAGTYEAEETIIRATNASSYDRLAGEKVWVKPFGSDWHIVDFVDADSDTITGALMEDIGIDRRGEVKVMLEGKKKAHLFVPDFVDDGNPRPVIDDDNKTVIFSNMNQSLYDTARDIPQPEGIIEIVVKVRSSGVGERTYQGCGAYFFRGYTDTYELTPIIHVYCGNGVTVSYDGLIFGSDNGGYDLVPSEDFVPNQWYWVKVTFTDTTMTFYISTDGENWEQIWEKSFPNSVFEQFTNARKECGLLPCKTGYLVDGEYDLTETYARIDNVYVFQPMRPVEQSY